MSRLVCQYCRHDFLSCLNRIARASAVSIIAVNFQSRTKEELVADLMANKGDVEYANVTATTAFSQCARYFYNGTSLGTLLNTTNPNSTTPLLGSDGLPIPLVPDKGIILSSGRPEDFNGQDSDKQTTQFTVSSTDQDLQSYVSHSVFDACWISFKFRCTSTAYVPTVSFNYVFGSEEYYEYVNSDFNDAFAFFLNGQNIARIPTTETATDIVSINNVNYDVNTKYFNGNDPGFNPKGNGPGYDPTGVLTKTWYPTIEADGFTTKLTAYGKPHTNQGEWNTIKLVVADVGDAILDSWVLLESGTFSCVDITSAPSVSSEPSRSPTKKPVTPSPTKKPTQQVRFETHFLDFRLIMLSRCNF